MTEEAPTQYSYPDVFILPHDRFSHDLPRTGTMGAPEKRFITADPLELVVYKDINKAHWPELLICDLKWVFEGPSLFGRRPATLSVMMETPMIVVCDDHIRAASHWGGRNIIGQFDVADVLDRAALEKPVAAFYAAARDAKGKVTPEAYKAALAALDAEGSGAQTPLFDGKRGAVSAPELR